MFSISSFRLSFVWFLVPVFLAGCALLKYEKYIFQGGDYVEVLLETDAPNWIVNAFISTSSVNCDGFKHAGTLFYDKILRDGGFLVQCKNIIHCDMKKILLCFIEFLHIQLFKSKLLHRIIQREAVACVAQ